MNILIDGQTLNTPDIRRGIGVYFINIINNLLKQDYCNRFYVTVLNKSSLAVFEPWVAEKIIPISCAEAHTTASYTNHLNRIIHDYHIDAYWNLNPLMLNVLFPDAKLNCNMFVTLYDLIPKVLPYYSSLWGNEIMAEYDRRIKYLSKNDVSVIAISESTKNDYKNVTLANNPCESIVLAANHRLFYRHLFLKKPQQKKRSIIYTAGIEYRKNIPRALEAFHLMMTMNPELDDLTFYLVCSYDNESRKSIDIQLKKLDLEKRVILTGYVSNHELAELYYNATVVFFPSLYEGFGLPILEAMLSGAYILSSNSSSLKEFEHIMFCDPTDIQDMANKLKTALSNSSNESLEDKKQRQSYALSFTWEATAEKTLRFITETPDIPYDKKPRVAIVAPWPPHKSGIAIYVYELVHFMAETCCIDIFVDNSRQDEAEFSPNPHGELYMINKLDELHGNYDAILYQLGNNCDFHTETYKYALKYKGIIELHDYIIHPFFHLSFYSENDFETYKNALVDGYGEEGLNHFNSIKDKGEWPDFERFPMAHALLNHCDKLIVHNQWTLTQLNNRKVTAIPLAAMMNEANAHPDHFHSIYGIQRDEMVVGCFGFVNKNKRPDKLMQAVRILRADGYPVKLIFFGSCDPNDLTQEENIHITGFLPTPLYLAGMQMVDVVVNLRFPSMGESSATLHEAFSFGKPVIISNVNQYKEYPDDICWKVDVNENEVPQLVAMIKHLFENKHTRTTLGENAKRYAQTVLDPQRIARRYADIIHQV